MTAKRDMRWLLTMLLLGVLAAVLSCDSSGSEVTPDPNGVRPSITGLDRNAANVGDTVEVYQQRIDVEGETVFADILRLGRLSIFWQTPDGKRAGEYDRVGKKWVEFPAGFSRSIQIAIEIANKRRPIELIKVPVGRLAP